MNYKQVFAVSCAMAFATGAYAQTWVSASVGNDSNSCTRALPCKTFQRAVSVTSVWGQVNVLDPGDYGSVTITQSMTIDGGDMVRNVATTGSAITVTAPGGIVQLRNLSLHGDGATTGINYTAGSQLLIEHVKINGFGGNCIAAFVTGSGNADLVVKDTSIDNCSNYGINITTSLNITAEIFNTHVHYANGGLVTGTGVISIYGSTFSAPGPGAYATGISTVAGATAVIMVDNCQLSNYNVAVYAPGGTIQLSRSTFIDNFTALQASSGTIVSNGNNSFLHNTFNGSPTTTSPLM